MYLVWGGRVEGFFEIFRTFDLLFEHNFDLGPALLNFCGVLCGMVRGDVDGVVLRCLWDGVAIERFWRETNLIKFANHTDP